MTLQQQRIGLLLLLLLGGWWIITSRVGFEGASPTATSPLPASANLPPAPLVGRVAPPFDLRSLDGTPVSLADQRGKVVLVNIWATWCPPCRAEMPLIQSSFSRYADRGFTVLALNVREDQATVAAFMQQYQLSFPAVLDPDGIASSAYQANSLPSSFFVDRQGIIRTVYRGPLSKSVLDGTIEQLLAEP